MQIGEIPVYSCLSYIDGTTNECLLSCFDSNKKLLFIEKNGETVFRAILRLTKGSYEGEAKRKKIEFADMLDTAASIAYIVKNSSFTKRILLALFSWDCYPYRSDFARERSVRPVP